MSDTITAPALTPTIRERVEAGAAWLDKIKPEWRNAVNVRLLDLGDGDACLLGQVFGNEVSYYSGYLYVYEAFFSGDEDQVIAHGFEAPPLHDDSRDYDTLTAAWQRYLTADHMGEEW